MLLGVIQFERGIESIASRATIAGYVASFVGIGFAAFNARWIMAQDAGNEKMGKIAFAIQTGGVRKRQMSALIWLAKLKQAFPLLAITVN